MQKLAKFLAMFLTVVVFGSCNKSNPVGPSQSSPFLYGQVVDSQGNPIDSVNLHYIPNLVHLAKSTAKKISSATMIEFMVPYRSYVNLSILRWYTRDFITTLVDDTLDAGAHVAILYDSSFTDGVYIYRLTVDTTTIEKNLIIIQDTASLPNTTPLAVTNSSGKFSEPLGVFGVGQQFDITTWQGTPIDTEYISDTIQIVLCKAGFKTLVQPVAIDTSKSVNQRFVLER